MYRNKGNRKLTCFTRILESGNNNSENVYRFSVGGIAHFVAQSMEGAEQRRDVFCNIYCCTILRCAIKRLRRGRIGLVIEHNSLFSRWDLQYFWGRGRRKSDWHSKRLNRLFDVARYSLYLGLFPTEH